MAGGASVAALFGVLLFQAWLYRSTAWDSLWYHVLMTHSYVMNGSTEWLEVGVPYASGYPNAVELLSAWPCAVLGETTFDDAGQLPFAFGGVCLICAWGRRLDVSVGAAITLAAAWLAMPPVILNLTSNLNDVTGAVGIGATVYYLWVAPRSHLRSWLVLASASLVVAAKGSGVVLLLPLAPFLVWDQLRAAKRGVLAIELPARATVLLGVGLYKQIENWIQTGNPLWPMETNVGPVHFDGPINPHGSTWGGGHGLDSFAFTGEGDFTRMITSWYDSDPGYQPNVLSGGFGPVHAYLGVPAIAFAVLWLAWRGRGEPVRGPLGAALVLIFVALMGPCPWWPRMILGASIGSILVLAGMAARLPRYVSAAIAGLALVVSLASCVPAMTEGVHSYGVHGVVRMWILSPAERARIPLGGLWPADVLAARDATFAPTDALAFDSEVELIGQFVPWDYGSRLVWVEPTGEDADYLARLHAGHARWVVAGPEARRRLLRLHATAIRHHGREWLFEVPP